MNDFCSPAPFFVNVTCKMMDKGSGDVCDPGWKLCPALKVLGSYLKKSAFQLLTENDIIDDGAQSRGF